LTKGNTTFYEYSRGEKPEVIEEFKIDLPSDSSDLGNNPSQEDHIDFGDDGGIDFGEETGSSETTSGENGDFVHVRKDDLDVTVQNTGDEINWDVATDVSIIDAASESKVAKGVDAMNILEYGQTRNSVINELYELEGFLDQRLVELRQEGDILTSNQFQSAPSELQLSNSDSITRMLKTVRAVLESMITDKMKLLYLLKDNPKYIENAVQKLKHKAELGEKAIAKSKLYEEKEREALEERKILAQQIPPLMSNTRELQSLIEEDISKRYKGRYVNLMGGVQVL
jgi:hypothetical protein